MTSAHNDSSLFTAFKAKDSRFDGRFFVGVSSTGIYCRPVCHAKMPQAKNCTFYASAAEAEQSGYRPCLVCRPEIAPGRSLADAKTSLAGRAAKLLEENSGNSLSLEALSGKLGCTARHLRRVFTEEYNVSPVQYVQTCRLLLAKNLLTDTALPVTDVALTAGFGSLRRFNDAFKKHYKLTPTALRKQVAQGGNHHDTVSLSLGYRPPYQWQQMLDYFSFRAIEGVEAIHNGEYRRTVNLRAPDGRQLQGWIRVKNNPEKNSILLTVTSSLLPALQQVLARVRHLFDLASDPEAVASVLASMNTVRSDLFASGVRIPGCFDSFEQSVRIVLGQQHTPETARNLAARFTRTFGTPIETDCEKLLYLFPTPQDLMTLEGRIREYLIPLGITSRNTESILALAQAHVNETFDVTLYASPSCGLGNLLELPGIDIEMAHSLTLHIMGWPDAFLETDYGVRTVLAPMSPQEILALSERWRPWRSYAMVSLWNSFTTSGFSHKNHSRNQERYCTTKAVQTN